MNIPAPLRASLLAVLGLASIASLWAQNAPSRPVNRIAANANLAPMTRLSGHLPRWVSPQTDAGVVPDEMPIQFTLLLSRGPERELAFTQLLIDQQNPSSPRYHQWLTPAQIGEEFGPSTDDVATITRWLTAHGMQVTSVAPSRIFVEVSSTTGAAAAAFSTSFHNFMLDGKPRLSVTTEPAIPSALAVAVSVINGLTELPLRSYHTESAAEPSAAGDGPHPMYSGTGNSLHYTFPGDFAKIYDINAITGAGFNGAGVKVAIIGRSQITTSDVTIFEGIAAVPTKAQNTILVPGSADPGLVKDDQGESTLDVDRVLTTSIGAQADLVIAATTRTNDGVNIAMNYNVQTLRDPIMSISYGLCETSATSAGVTAMDALFKQAASEGISTFVSSGDSAASTCSTAFAAPPTQPPPPGVAAPALSINYLCASSYVTCVGGTEFNDTSSPSIYWSATNGTGYVSATGYIPEGAWNEPVDPTGAYQIAGTGGGVSTVIAKPTWQIGTGVPADGMRDVPDVSFTSALHDGYYSCLSTIKAYDCSQGGAVLFSGTSAATPGMAAIAAILVQKTGKPQGNLNPLLYALAASNPAAFHDATPATSGVGACTVGTASMCNNSTPSTTGLTGGLAGYPLQVGYDLATGLGSLDVSNFIVAASGPVLLGSTTTVTASPSTVVVGKSAVFTATVAGSGSTAPTGMVQFFLNGSVLGSAVPLAGRTASTSTTAFPAAGTYSITAIYSGDSNYSSSTSATLSFVVTLPATTTTVTATPTAVTTGGTAVFTATVSASTATGTVQLYSNGNLLGSPLPLSAGRASTASTQFTTPGTYAITAVYSGDTNNAGSTSAAINFVVTAATVSGLTATATPTTLSVTAGAGSGNTSTIALATTASFFGNVSLSCGVANSTSTIYPPTCTFSPATVTFSGGTTGSSILTLGTTAPRAVPGGLRTRNSNPFVPIGSLSLASLLLVLIPAKRRRTIGWLAILPLVLLGAITGCGSSGANTGPSTPVGTSKGSYAITVTATPSAGTAATATVTLTVQ